MNLPDSVIRQLKTSIAGEVLLDDFSCGRYATDASVYQMTPLGVVLPQDFDDVRTCLAIAREAGVPLLARGGGTSQCGQTVNNALVLDNSTSLNR
ncbi:MAG: FAD-binding protein, partial [Pseudomonadota bacterium]